jgi:hypothetical protein
MSSHVLSVTGVLSASSLAEGERIEVRGSFMLTITKPSPYPLRCEGRGEYIALTT